MHPKTPLSTSSKRPLGSLRILFPTIPLRPLPLSILIHTSKRPRPLRLRRQKLPIPNRRPQRQSHLIILIIWIRISAFELTKFRRGAVFARGCDAEVFFAEAGAE